MTRWRVRWRDVDIVHDETIEADRLTIADGLAAWWPEFGSQRGPTRVLSSALIIDIKELPSDG